jgi:hypothetical protein
MLLGEIRSWRPQDAPEGVSGVELPERGLRALLIPRAHAGDLRRDPDLDGHGVLFLTGPGPAPDPDADTRPQAFLGATSDLLSQLAHWDSAPPLSWEAAVVVPVRAPRIARFHQELIKLTQFHCHRWAAGAGLYQILSPEPTCPSLVPAAIERDLKAQRSAIQTLLVALRHPVLGTRPGDGSGRARA